MTPEAEHLIRESWAAMQPMGDRVVTTFYARLFASSPRAAALFASTDMVEQKKKFAAMLTEIVRMLDQPEQLVTEMADSGRRHMRFGVRTEDYDDVGAALIWALEHELGAAFTPAVRTAWREAYSLLAGMMKRAASHLGSESTANPL